MGDYDHDARTIHCANLPIDKITEELLYELFLQVCKHLIKHFPHKQNIPMVQLKKYGH